MASTTDSPNNVSPKEAAVPNKVIEQRASVDKSIAQAKTLSDEDAAAALQLLSSSGSSGSSHSSRSRSSLAKTGSDPPSPEHRQSRHPSAAPAAPEHLPNQQIVMAAKEKPISPSSSSSSSLSSSTASSSLESHRPVQQQPLPDGTDASRPALPPKQQLVMQPPIGSKLAHIITTGRPPPVTTNTRPPYDVPSHLSEQTQGQHYLSQRSSISSSAAVTPTSAAKKKIPRVCSMCGTTETPTWRRGPKGASLCNACGLRFAKPASSRTVKKTMENNPLAGPPIGAFQHPSLLAAQEHQRQQLQQQLHQENAAARRSLVDAAIHRGGHVQAREEQYHRHHQQPRMVERYPYPSHYGMDHYPPPPPHQSNGGTPPGGRYRQYLHQHYPSYVPYPQPSHDHYPPPQERPPAPMGMTPPVHDLQTTEGHSRDGRHIPLDTLPSIPLPKDAALKNMRLAQYTASSVLVCQPDDKSDDPLAKKRRQLQWPLQISESSLARERQFGNQHLISLHHPHYKIKSDDKVRPSLEVPVGQALPEMLQEALVTNQMAHYVTGWQLKSLSDLDAREYNRPAGQHTASLPPIITNQKDLPLTLPAIAHSSERADDHRTGRRSIDDGGRHEYPSQYHPHYSPPPPHQPHQPSYQGYSRGYPPPPVDEQRHHYPPPVHGGHYGAPMYQTEQYIPLRSAPTSPLHPPPLPPSHQP